MWVVESAVPSHGSLHAGIGDVLGLARVHHIIAGIHYQRRMQSSLSSNRGGIQICPVAELPHVYFRLLSPFPIRNQSSWRKAKKKRFVFWQSWDE